MAQKEQKLEANDMDQAAQYNKFIEFAFLPKVIPRLHLYSLYRLGKICLMLPFCVLCEILLAHSFISMAEDNQKNI